MTQYDPVRISKDESEIENIFAVVGTPTRLSVSVEVLSFKFFVCIHTWFVAIYSLLRS